MTFFIHDPVRLVITPLPEIFYRRKITDPDQLSGSQPTRGVLTQTEQFIPSTHQHSSHNKPDHKMEAYEQAEESLSSDEPTAAELMSSPVMCTSAETSIEKLWQHFKQHNVHHIGLISESGMLSGIASYESLLEFIMAHPPYDLNWREASAKDLSQDVMITATPDTNLSNLAMVMLSHQVSAIPIVTSLQLKDNSNTRRLEGIVTNSDILKSSLRHGIHLQV